MAGGPRAPTDPGTVRWGDPPLHRPGIPDLLPPADARCVAQRVSL